MSLVGPRPALFEERASFPPGLLEREILRPGLTGLWQVEARSDPDFDRYHQLDLDWITVCTRLRATGMPIKTIRRYAQLVSAGPGNEQERLALMEAHRADVTAKLAELQENLKIIDHKINVYRGRLAAGDADQLWAPNRLAGAR